MEVKGNASFPAGKVTSLGGGWQLFKARLFGRKYVSRAGRFTLVAYYYKGTYYITRYNAL